MQVSARLGRRKQPTICHAGGAMRNHVQSSSIVHTRGSFRIVRSKQFCLFFSFLFSCGKLIRLHNYIPNNTFYKPVQHLSYPSRLCTCVYIPLHCGMRALVL